MKKSLISWVLPFFIATVIIIVLRVYFIQIHLVKNNGLKNTLLKNDKVVCFNSKSLARNNIVLARWKENNEPAFKRIIALPMDTVLIKNSIVYVNRGRSEDNSNITYTYSFSTDSITYARKLLDNNNLVFDPKLATIGVFRFTANIDGLKKVKIDSMLYNVKRIIDNPSVSFTGNKAFSPVLYWNKDNMGPLFVPGKGSKLRITEKVYSIYKQIIEKESGKLLELINHKVYLSKTPLYLYTFKRNYYFLLNDNRQDINDSRTYGLIPEDQIINKVWFKLPW